MSLDADGRRPIPARNLAVMRDLVRRVAGWGFTPNGVSIFGLALGVGSGLLLALTSALPGGARLLWIVSAVLVGLRGISNTVDGMLAVEHGRGSASGIFYNELPDRISDVALFAGAGYSLGGSPAAGWLAACLALFVTYVRAIGVLAGAPADFGGPFAKQQRMFSVAILSCVLAVTPSGWWFAWGPGGGWGPMAAWLWIMSAGMALTAIRRLRRAVASVTRPTRNG
jgi:phosphatidylglycerophosphate synthase